MSFGSEWPVCAGRADITRPACRRQPTAPAGSGSPFVPCRQRLVACESHPGRAGAIFSPRAPYLRSCREVSIFTKDCPVCAASHPVHVVRCGCGYCFDPNKLDGVTQELEVISQEEQLYRDYLAARADQADKAMQSAKAAAAHDRANTVKAAEALLAEQTAMNARAEMDAQTQRAIAVKNRIKVVRSNRRARKARGGAASAARSTPIPAREALAPKPVPKPTPKPTLAPPPPAPARIAPPAPLEVAARPVTPKPIAAPAPAAPAPHIAAAPAPVITVRQIEAPPKPVAPKVEPPRVQALAATPPAPVRAQTAPAARKTAPAPVLLDRATPSFRAAQATKAAQAAPASAPPKALDCPNCSAKVPLTVKRCRCGFEMPHFASQIPSLALSAEDREAFLAALSPVSGDHNR